MDQFDRQLGAERRRNASLMGAGATTAPVGTSTPTTASQQSAQRVKAPSATASVGAGVRLRLSNTPSSSNSNTPATGHGVGTPLSTAAANSAGTPLCKEGINTSSGGSASVPPPSTSGMGNLAGFLDPEFLAVLSNRQIARQVTHEIARLVLKQSGSPVPATLSDETANRIVCTLATELSQLHNQSAGHQQTKATDSNCNRPSSTSRSSVIKSPNGEEVCATLRGVTPSTAHVVLQNPNCAISGRSTIESELLWSEVKDIPQGVELSRPHAPLDEFPIPYDRDRRGGAPSHHNGVAWSNSYASPPPAGATSYHTRDANGNTTGGHQAHVSGYSSQIGSNHLNDASSSPIRPKPVISKTVTMKQQLSMPINPFLMRMVDKVGGGAGGSIASVSSARKGAGGSTITRSASSAFSECSTGSYGSTQRRM